jgi:dTDP-4-amino-4,6-dideoxygalactose transaminase
MNIPFVDLKTQYASIKKEIDRAISEVLTGAHFVQGPEVAQFEKDFASYLGAHYCLGVNSGTDALILGIRALGLSPGDEVIVPVNTFIATALGVSENGLKPVFVDIDPIDYGLDLNDVRKKITAKTKAIIAVHLFGQPEKIGEIQEIIKKSGKSIQLIEDACQAHGAFYRGKKVGTFGVFSAFSFYPGKNLGAYGDGGAFVTNDEDVASRIRMLREYGQQKKYVHASLGTNSRLDTLQAAILEVKLKHLDAWNIKRQRWAAYYTSRLNKIFPSVQTPLSIPERLSVFHLYVVQVDKRDKLLKFLNDKGIQALIHYPTPLHLQGAYKQLGYKLGDFPNVERVADRIISLPMHPDLTREQVDFVIQSMKEFYGR